MQQPSDQVRIRTGRGRDIQKPAKEAAQQFQEYAALAAIVYRSVDSQQVPDPAGWRRSTQDGDTVDRQDTGLYYEVRERGSEEAAIVMRGTEFTDLKDWWSNARWVTRFIPTGWDQYDLIRSQIRGVAERHKGARIVTVGHSLGGGLAQQAAYAHPDIDTVFAFDSSPVTGYRSVPPQEVEENQRNIKIFRVYEKGEILAFIRGLVRWAIPLSDKDPEITEVRFNFRGWEAFGALLQHSMVQLALDLEYAAAGLPLGAPVGRQTSHGVLARPAEMANRGTADNQGQREPRRLRKPEQKIAPAAHSDGPPSSQQDHATATEKASEPIWHSVHLPIISAVIAMVMGLGSLAPNDPLIVITLLVISWGAFLWFFYVLAGSRVYRALGAIGVTALLGWMAVRLASRL